VACVGIGSGLVGGLDIATAGLVIRTTAVRA